MRMENKCKRRIGDRVEGRKLRTIEPITTVAPFIMPSRVGASNYIQDSVPMSYLDSYIHKKRNDNMPGLGAMHLLVSSYIRTVSQCPGINRFLSGLRIYARHNIEIIMAVKQEMKLDAPETMIKFEFSPDATLYDVYNEFNAKISEYKNTNTNEDNAFDSLAKFLGYIPRFILSFIIKFLGFLDYFGWLPRFLTKLSPFHGSLVITSMASLGIPSLYHHLYDFGNVPMFISFSTIRRQNEMDKEGNIKTIRYLDLNFTTDERICDGHYYAHALKLIKKYLKNPELLEIPPEQVIKDID